MADEKQEAKPQSYAAGSTSPKVVHAEAIGGALICLAGKAGSVTAVISGVTDLASCFGPAAQSAEKVRAMATNDRDHFIEAVDALRQENKSLALEHATKIGDGHIRDGLKNLINLIGDPANQAALKMFIQFISSLFGTPAAPATG